MIKLFPPDAISYSSTNKDDWDSSKPVKITFITQHGEEKLVEGPTGMDLLTLAHKKDVDLEGNR